MKPKPSCSSKSRFLPSAILASFLILVFSSGIAFAQEEIAVISKFNGEVKVIHEGKELVVEKIGNRIKNSSVYSDDSVITMPGANVDLVFLDNSRLEVKENTTITITTGQIAEKDRIAKKETLRNIKLKAGNLWASITPSKSVLTAFETLSGTAYARGTEVWVGFDPATGAAIIDLGEGLVYFVMPGEPMGINMTSGDTISVTVDPVTGTATIIVEAGEVTIVDEVTGEKETMTTGQSKEVVPPPPPLPTPPQPSPEQPAPEPASPST